MFALSRVTICLVAVLLAAGAVQAQTPSTDAILVRLLEGAHRDAYDLRAEFSGTLTLTVAGTRQVIRAAGTLSDTLRPGQPRQIKATVTKVETPLLIRPVAGSIRNVIEDLIETQGDDPTATGAHDVTLVELRPDGQALLGGVRQDIVTEAIQRYRPGTSTGDRAVRQAVAKWLYTSPAMQAWIRRSGPPYAFGVLVDDAGLPRETVVSYDWGQVGNRISYVAVSGHVVWSTLALDVAGQVAGLGNVTGQLVIEFAKHRL